MHTRIIMHGLHCAMDTELFPLTVTDEMSNTYCYYYLFREDDVEDIYKVS